MQLEQFTPEIEHLFVQFMCSDPETFVRVRNIIKPSFWDDPELRSTVQFVLEYTDTHSSMPTREQIRAVSGIDIEPVSEINTDHIDWFMLNIERFCQQKAAREAVHRSIDLIREDRLGEVVEAVRAAAELGIVRDLGTDYFADPEARLRAMRERKNMVSTGWTHIDQKLYGGFNRGEISIFVGQSGAGKSLFLQNLALNWAQLGLNVVYISLELSEELCSMRLDSMTTGYSQRDIMKNMSDVALKVGAFRKQCRGENGASGTLQVKQLRSGCSTNDIRSYIKEYETQSKLKVDAVLVDYLDLCMPYSVKVSPSDQFIKDKFVSEELRNIAVEYNCLMATASQLNRGSHDEIEFGHQHIAGGISKINTADNVLAIFTTISMKESGRYQIQFLKTRSSAGVGSKVDLSFDAATLRIGNLSDAEQDAVTASTATVLSQLRRDQVVTDEEKAATEPPRQTLKNSLQLRDLVKRTATVTKPS